MLEWSHDKLSGGHDPHGGIMSLLRVMKVRCRSALACLALRDPSGKLSMASFPVGAAVPPWSNDRIEEALEEIWEDPSLRAGTIMLRISHQAGGARPLRIAAAPLRWAEHGGESWGLLCLLDPLGGDFDQEQCDLLSNFASRVVAYYQARDEILHEQPLGAERASEQARRRASVSEPVLVHEAARLHGDEEPGASGTGLSPKQAKGKGKGKKRKKSKQPGAKAGKDLNAGIDEIPTTGFVQELMLDGHPSKAETERISQVTLRLLERQTWPPFAEDLEPGQAPAAPTPLDVQVLPSIQRERRDLLASLESDPTTGLGGLPALLGELGSALNAPHSGSSCVVLTLLELRSRGESAPSPELAIEVSRALRSHVRGDDAVFRLDDRVFAVTTTLRSKAIFPSNIEERLAAALRIVLTSTKSSFELRTANTYSTGAAAIPRPEAFFEEAVAELRS